jgi:hypothetical protein
MWSCGLELLIVQQFGGGHADEEWHLGIEP